jgi:hypothetical protein
VSLPLRILVTGSRDWTDRGLIERALADVIAENHVRTPKMLVHGGARGADSLADAIWRGWRVPGDGSAGVEVHRADWEQFGKAAGHRRNAEMVAAGADICLAFILGESRGTRGCIALAEKAGIPVRVFEGVAP